MPTHDEHCVANQAPDPSFVWQRASSHTVGIATTRYHEMMQWEEGYCVDAQT